MRFNKQKSYPYPVIRDFNDDYLDEKFTVNIKTILDIKHVELSIDYNLSSMPVQREIKSGNATYLTVISCRDTFYHKVFTSDKSDKNLISISHELLSGKVMIESFVYVTKDTSIASSSINKEYLSVNSGSISSFYYKKGNVIAQAQAFSFQIEVDLFKPLGSIFSIEVDEKMSNGEWVVFSDSNIVTITVARDIKDLKDELSSDKEGQSIMLNTIYFAALMHLVQLIKDDDSGAIIDHHTWAKIVDERITLKGINSDNEEAYAITTKILDFPFIRLSREEN